MCAQMIIRESMECTRKPGLQGESSQLRLRPGSLEKTEFKTSLKLGWDFDRSLGKEKGGR